MVIPLGSWQCCCLRYLSNLLLYLHFGCPPRPTRLLLFSLVTDWTVVHLLIFDYRSFLFLLNYYNFNFKARFICFALIFSRSKSPPFYHPPKFKGNHTRWIWRNPTTLDGVKSVSGVRLRLPDSCLPEARRSEWRLTEPRLTTITKLTAEERPYNLSDPDCEEEKEAQAEE